MWSTRKSISQTARTIRPLTRPGHGFSAKRARAGLSIPCIEHGLAPYDGKIEINVIAAKPGSAASKRHVDAGVATAFRHQPQAVKAGDLLFIPALMAADQDGL